MEVLSMENLNSKTKNKIEEVKELIKNKISVKEIIREKFNTHPKMIKWLDKNNIFFNDTELNYLGYVQSLEIVEEGEENIYHSENNNITVPTLLNSNIKALNDKEKLNLLLSDDTLVLLQILAKKMNNNVSGEVLDIPNTYFNLKDIKIKNCRISDDIYSRVVNFAKEKDITITVLLNYILDSFLKSHNK